MEANTAFTPLRVRQFTLRMTLMTAFCGLIVLGGVFLSSVTSIKVADFIREELRMRLNDEVSIAASQINGDLHSHIRQSGDENGATYKQLQTQLQQFRDRGTNLRYVYTMRKQDNGRVTFVVDAESSPETRSHIGEIYTNATPAMMAALEAVSDSKTAFVETEPSVDEFGTWLSAYSPIYTGDGKLDGILGIDVSAESIYQHEHDYKIRVWILCGVVLAMVLPVGFFIAHRIRKPLAQLTVEMEKVRQFDLDGEVQIRTRIREIDSMVTQLENMKRGLRSFRKYVPDDLVRELIELGADAKLGGNKKELTIFFSDIADFTAMSEKMKPEIQVHYLGQYLNVMNAALLGHCATVDKYIGDGVMAFWGAPRPLEDHAVLACRAALMCQAHVNALNDQWHDHGIEYRFHTRIGINTGDVIVGNMGSDERMSYTVIGDNVNLASRLEGINKIYGTSILITEATKIKTGKYFITRLIDRVVMTGKTVPIDIYELVGEDGSISAGEIRKIRCYEEAYLCYAARRFSQAIVILEELLAGNSDTPSVVLLKRCRNYLTAPPDDDWNGAYCVLRDK
ncbi:MAG TPA: adenylate/guanylate cyclase domain-containing protein [Pseudomonadales bacterium]|nr:adenylate/guanylate cyclase domain-containing protein [Pseudomonadales bacterium]